MDGYPREDVFTKLKSSSSANAYNGLMEIRSRIVKTREGVEVLKRMKVLKDLVGFLSQPNKKNLDMALSILGNCCMDQECRLEVITYNIIGLLSTILQGISRDTVQCRACRLIGNLAMDSSIAEQLHKEGILPLIISIVEPKSNSSVATKQMAVRALKMLWNAENYRDKMLNCNAVHSVALLLSSAQKKEEFEFLQAIVKALAAFSRSHSELCAEQIQSDELTYQHLVSLLGNPNLKPIVLSCICSLTRTATARPALGNAGVVKIIIKEILGQRQDNTGAYVEIVVALCYLSRESVNRAKIRDAGGLPVMLEILRNCSVPALQGAVLNGLTQFVYDELSLEELLKEGLVFVLVDKIASYVKEHGQVHSKCSEISEVKEDIHKMAPSSSLEKKSCKKKSLPSSSSTSQYVSKFIDHKSYEENLQEIRRPQRSSPNHQGIIQEQGNSYRSSNSNMTRCKCFRDSSPETNLAMKNQFNFDSNPVGFWSPESPNSICLSPEASPPQRRFQPGSLSPYIGSVGISPPATPPIHYYMDNADDTDYPEVYSPVCCDLDEDSEGEYQCVDDDCILHEDILDDEENDLDIKSESLHIPPVESSKSNTSELVTVILFLSRISHIEKPVEELATHKTVSSLLDYMTLIRNPLPRVSRILLRIIRNHHYFTQLMLHRVVLTIHSHLCQPQHAECILCNEFKSVGLVLFAQISILAHSGFGEGELAHQLLKGEESIQQLMAVSIPFVVRIHRILWKLLMECGGLNILLGILVESNFEVDGYSKYVIASLKLLATSLGVLNPYHRTEEAHTHDDKYPVLLNELDTESVIINSTTKISDDAVFLQLDDGSSIQVSKTYLSSKSPMFEAMFRGGFKESSEDYVPLPGISHYCLINLLRVLKLGYVPSCIPDIDLSTSLELMAVLDRFLISGSEQLTEMIVGKFLSPDTLLHIYTRCVEAGDVIHFHTLRHDTVRFMLTSNSSHMKIDKTLKSLLQSPYKTELQSDISDVMEERLTDMHYKPSKFLLHSQKPNIKKHGVPLNIS